MKNGSEVQIFICLLVFEHFHKPIPLAVSYTPNRSAGPLWNYLLHVIALASSGGCCKATVLLFCCFAFNLRFDIHKSCPHWRHRIKQLKVCVMSGHFGVLI
jgi:hypothetical protein